MRGAFSNPSRVKPSHEQTRYLAIKGTGPLKQHAQHLRLAGLRCARTIAQGMQPAEAPYPKRRVEAGVSQHSHARPSH